MEKRKLNYKKGLAQASPFPLLAHCTPKTFYAIIIHN